MDLSGSPICVIAGKERIHPPNYTGIELDYLLPTQRGSQLQKAHDAIGPCFSRQSPRANKQTHTAADGVMIEPLFHCPTSPQADAPLSCGCNNEQMSHGEWPRRTGYFQCKIAGVPLPDGNLNSGRRDLRAAHVINNNTTRQLRASVLPHPTDCCCDRGRWKTRSSFLPLYITKLSFAPHSCHH